MENFGYITGSPPPFIIMAFGLAGYFGSLGAFWQINTLPGELFYRRNTRYFFLITNFVWLSLLLLPLARIILTGNFREGVLLNQAKIKVLLFTIEVKIRILLFTIDTSIIVSIFSAITCIFLLYIIAYTATRQYKGVTSPNKNGRNNFWIEDENKEPRPEPV